MLYYAVLQTNDRKEVVKLRIVIGEPILNFQPPEDIIGPIGQLHLYKEARNKYPTRELMISRLRQEYKSIVRSLKDMSIRFSVLLSHPEEFDDDLCEFLDPIVGDNKVFFPEHINPVSTLFPRDFCVSLPGITMIYDLYESDDQTDSFIVSPYGEGGRVLYCRDKVLIGEELVGHEIQKLDHIELLKKKGFKIGLLPLPLTYGTDRICGLGGHLDRVACLIKDRRKRVHFVIDPKIETILVESIGVDGKPKGARCSNEDTLKLIRSTCDRVKIKVHTPEKMEVAGSLGLIQFEDGRVLMTSGDNSVAETIRGIVGKDNLFFTDIPIEAYPGFLTAGIRCLVGEIPKQ